MKQKEEIKQHVLALAQAAYDKKGHDIEILDYVRRLFYGCKCQ